MNRKTFLKTLSAILLAPKALANIKPKRFFKPTTYTTGFTVTRQMIEDDYFGNPWHIGNVVNTKVEIVESLPTNNRFKVKFHA